MRDHHKEDDIYRVVATALDAAFMHRVYPELAPAGRDMLRHYVSSGWREGLDPAPWFSSEGYLAANADVARAGLEPFYHYLTRGRREGREIAPSRHAVRYLTAAPTPWSLEMLLNGPPPVAPPEPAPFVAEAAAAEAGAEPEVEASLSDADRALVAGEFDAAYYLAAHPDIATAGMDPLHHFVVTGWREGRNPAPAFSVRDYLETYPDVALSGMNPFVHFLRTGRAEGRAGRTDLGFRYEIIKALTPVQVRAAAAAAVGAGVKLKTQAALRKALGAAAFGLADLHITFSHDDFTAHTGGVQLCLQRESARVAAQGRDHLHLFPAAPWPVVRDDAEPGQLGALLNGVRIGAFAPSVVAGGLAKAMADAPRGRRTFAIHSLLGHTADETAEILAAAGLQAGFFWLHDFASLCAGFHLLRNDVEDCAAPPPDSAACRICIYGAYRARHLDQHQRLFERLDLTVVSPSEPTLDLWRARWNYPAKGEVVLPHATLVARGRSRKSSAKRTFRLGYPGMPVAHKGWEIFHRLALRYADDPRYEFMHFGGQPAPGLDIAFHRVVVTEDEPRAMQAAIEAAKVDAVLIWPLCRETFSFTAYEAAAAGAAVLTGPDSGNVAAFVTRSGLGRVAPDEAALDALLDSGDILALGRAARSVMLYDLAFSGLSVDVADPEAAA
ncbi:hypothetical protein [Phenylobacterium sp.]|uniref:hypothetical protein n=1 Tax=Phenylobacterium sp. TaxID=1871053 RepID=UPI0039837FFC